MQETINELVKRVEILEENNRRQHEVIMNLVDSGKLTTEAIIDHISSLESDRDSILASYEASINRMLKRIEAKYTTPEE